MDQEWIWLWKISVIALMCQKVFIIQEVFCKSIDPEFYEMCMVGAVTVALPSVLTLAV